MEEMKGFINGAHLKEEILDAVARAEFWKLFLSNCLPILGIVDDGSLLKGVVMTMYKVIKVACRAVDI